VFPVKYNVKKSFEYMAQATKENQPLQAFAITLKGAFDYFESKKQLPVILINERGSISLIKATICELGQTRSQILAACLWLHGFVNFYPSCQRALCLVLPPTNVSPAVLFRTIW
jgi:hypothetical protein